MTTMMIALVKANVVQQIADHKKYVQQHYLGTADKAAAQSLVFDNKSFEAAFVCREPGTNLELLLDYRK